MFKNYINIFLIYIYIKEKYAIFPTLRLIFSLTKRIFILIYKLNLNNNSNLLFKFNRLKFLKFILLKNLIKYRNILNFKCLKTFIEYNIKVLGKKIKIVIKFIYKKKKQDFFLIFINKFYIFICILFSSIMILINIFLLIFITYIIKKHK